MHIGSSFKNISTLEVEPNPIPMNESSFSKFLLGMNLKFDSQNK
jgi:hypothetical protein